MSVVLRIGGSWTRQERNWARKSQEARLGSSKESDARSPGAASPCTQRAGGDTILPAGVLRGSGGPSGCAASSQPLNWSQGTGAGGGGGVRCQCPCQPHLTWMTTSVSWHCSRKRKHLRMP